MSDRVYVPADRTGAEFQRFTDSRTAPHERIPNHWGRDSHGAIKQFLNVAAWRRECTQDDRAKHGTKSMRPPFVEKVDRTINLLPPTLHLRHFRKLLERETSVFDGPTTLDLYYLRLY